VVSQAPDPAGGGPYLNHGSGKHQNGARPATSPPAPRRRLRVAEWSIGRHEVQLLFSGNWPTISATSPCCWFRSAEANPKTAARAPFLRFEADFWILVRTRVPFLKAKRRAPVAPPPTMPKRRAARRWAACSWLPAHLSPPAGCGLAVMGSRLYLRPRLPSPESQFSGRSIFGEVRFPRAWPRCPLWLALCPATSVQRGELACSHGLCGKALPGN
jgi:hypothetical protein